MPTNTKVVRAFPLADVTTDCIEDQLDCDFLRPGTMMSAALRPA